jgi:hypothetical protein
MYLLTKEDYQKLKIASAAENNGGAGGGGEKKEQVNNIDVSHGGTLLINSKDFDGCQRDKREGEEAALKSWEEEEGERNKERWGESCPSPWRRTPPPEWARSKPHPPRRRRR